MTHSHGKIEFNCRYFIMTFRTQIHKKKFGKNGFRTLQGTMSHRTQYETSVLYYFAGIAKDSNGNWLGKFYFLQSFYNQKGSAFWIFCQIIPYWCKTRLSNANSKPPLNVIFKSIHAYFHFLAGLGGVDTDERAYNLVIADCILPIGYTSVRGLISLIYGSHTLSTGLKGCTEKR